MLLNPPPTRSRSLLLGALLVVALTAGSTIRAIESAPDQDAAPLAFQKPSLSSRVPTGSGLQRVLTLENPSEAAVNVAFLESSLSTLSLSHRRGLEGDQITVGPEDRVDRVIQPGKSMQVRVDLDTAELEVGDLDATIRALDEDRTVLAEMSWSLEIYVEDAEEDIDPKDEAIGEIPERVEVTGPPPKIVFDRYVHDFGTQLAGGTISTEFSFRNEGEGELIIQSLRRECSCSFGKITLPSGVVTRKQRIGQDIGVLGPGESGSLEVKVDTAEFSGLGQRKRFHIYTNDPLAFPVTVAIGVDIISPFTYNPPTALFGEVIRSERPSQNIRVRSSHLDDFDIVGHEQVSPPLFDVSFRKLKVVKDKPGYAITLQVRDDARFGEHKGTVKLLVEHEEVKEFHVTYGISVKPDIQFSILSPPSSDPHKMNFGILRNTDVAGKFLIENLNPDVPYVPRNVRIEYGYKNEGEPVEAEIVTLEEGMRYELNLRVVKKPKLSFLKGSVYVESDHQGLPSQKLEFNGIYRGK